MGGGLTPQDFVRFVNDGGNLLVAVSSELSDFHRKLGKQFGIDFEPRGSWAIDHSEFAEQNNQTDHRLIAATNLAKVPAVLSPEILTGGSGTNASLPVFYKGIAHRYQAKNPLLIPLLVGSTTTYSGKTEVDKDGNIRSAAVDDMPLSGKSVGLVSVFQTRNNARVAFSGSTALFSDPLFKRTESGNAPFVESISKWVFQEKSVLRESNHRHYLLSTGEQPDHYLITNDMVYEIDLSVYNNDKWHPYKADDVQFEAIMLDPYIRVTLNRTQTSDSSATAATYHGHIRLPDRYGTFTFRVNYKRTGYSNVDVQDTVAIWPLRHDGYPRFLTAAYPYYTGSLVMVLGFLALSAVWLWNAEPAALKESKDMQKPRDDEKKKTKSKSK
ncbi:oligosaccharyl transferase glycoprotein complex, beta subunit [Coemansia erecta]|nr:oligosaccharyl transferase glycoprotein complex, beta subunit [Coemansia erecta]